MKRTVYKLVNLNQDKSFSSWILRPEDIGCVFYQLNKTTRPTIENSFLFAFSSLEKAFSSMAFSKHRSDDNEVLLECEAEVSEDQHEILIVSNWVTQENKLAEFWLDSSSEGFCGYKISPPPGTVFCLSITPLRVISNKELLFPEIK